MATQTISRPVGRPPLELDWELIDEHLEAGCSGISIARTLKIHADTLYDAIQRKYNMNFTDYSCKFHTVGDDLLKKTQFDKAIGRTKKGDTTLLLHLGRTRLKQTDALPERKEISPNDAQLDDTFTAIKKEGENQKLREEIRQLREELSAFRDQTNPILQRSDEAI